MKDIKKIEFHNPPTPQHEAVLKEKQAIREEEERAEREAPIQEEIKREIAEVESPPKPLEWWIKRIAFWGLLAFIVFDKTVPAFRWFKYNLQSSKEIEFMKQHPEYAKITVDLYNLAHGKADADLKDKFNVVKETYK